MNKAQRGAWFALVGCLFNIAIAVYLVVKIYVLKSLPRLFWEGLSIITAICVLLVLSIVLYSKKQSQAEVESDERDKLIQKRAVLVSFVSVWILLGVLSIILGFIPGVDGSIPVWLLAIINVCIFLIVMTIYHIAVLVQYGRGGKDVEG